MSAPRFRPDLQLADWVLDLSRPVLMGVVNANPDSFSDPGHRPLDVQLDQVRAMVDEGAGVIDVGGQSGITNVAEVDPSEEIDRVLPLVEAIVAELPQVVISVDTYKPPVIAAVLAAGAHIVNDVSGLRSPELAPLVARHRAGLVVMHTAAPPKTRLQSSDLYGDVVADVTAFLAAKVAEAVAAGVDERSILVDPGPDFTKTPAQTVEVLRHLATLNPQGLPALLALSRKDFIGALTGTRPKERLAGTLAAVAAVGSGSGVVLRVHDVGEVRRFLTVLEVLEGERPGRPGAAPRRRPALGRRPPRRHEGGLSAQRASAVRSWAVSQCSQNQVACTSVKCMPS
ncbi:dihydropteroate synthase [Aquihabitans sp. G128]|uniref:dihydropteroate synthase n=1 Tax=Aquihabitans sp. G128 TaxID=2849779 RepID=UPI001C23929F|nr:dihydropteroate synthase [Aquihabitans sp. G128]QXC61089.1 dihydropteroate synthase [Aquihabitans sp. G128]